MNVRPLAVCRLTCALFVILGALPLAAQSPGSRPLIALYEPSGLKSDTALTSALCTVADSVELDLACLQRFDVRRLPAVDPARDLPAVRSYCQTNRIDQAILGSGSSRPAGGYAFRLVLYDRRTDSVTLEQAGSCSGALDMFDTTDTLVAALLDKLAGTHLLFGSLTVQTVPEGAVVSLNSKEVGLSPISLRGLPVGELQVSARMMGWEEGGTTAKVQDNQITDTTLTLQRSVGTLRLDMPKDAYVKVRATGMAERILWGPTSEELPTGSYELEAICPGLSTVKQSFTVARNGTASLRPWAGAYLEVDAGVEGAAVAVDGVMKGAAPLVVEVDPGILHRVELRKDKYELYQAELSVGQARKVSFRPEMTMKMGSVRVESEPGGVAVRLDDGRVMNTPCTFDDVTPGPHTISAWDCVIDRRWYRVTNETSVDVAADQQAVATLQTATGTATLAMAGLPAGAQVFVDGDRWQPGTRVPAGTLDILVTTPADQTWKGTVSAAFNDIAPVNLDTLTASVPRRHIKVDGSADDWTGIEPLWGGVKEKGSKYWFKNEFQMDPFPNQSGTNLKAAYICRDDREIYVRIDFDDGEVRANLTKDIKDSLNREIHCYVRDGKSLNAGVSSTRQWGDNSWLGTWQDSTKTWTPIANTLDAFAIKGSTLEFAIPLSRVKDLLSDGAVEVEVAIADAGPSDWNNGYVTYRRRVDFLK